MVEKIINEFSDILDATGYSLWFGTKNSYNGKRDWNKQEVILEPFRMPLDTENFCEWETEWNLWICKAQDFGLETLNVNAKLMDLMLKDGLAIIEALNASEYFSVISELSEQATDFYPPNSNKVANNQALLNLSFTIKIWEIE